MSLMDVGCSFVDGSYKKLDKSIHLGVVVVVVGYFKSIIKENMS